MNSKIASPSLTKLMYSDDKVKSWIMQFVGCDLNRESSTFLALNAIPSYIIWKKEKYM